jgi:hypothetical protein
MPMEKKVVQDVIPGNRRTIRNVSPKRIDVVEEDGEESVPVRRRLPLRESPPTKKRRGPAILLTFIVVFVGIAVIAVALSLLYSKAAVTITPKVARFDIDGTFTAKKDADSSSASTLGYATIGVSDSMSELIPATDGPTISTKAKGTVTLYNEQTTQQKIIAGTRLINTSGEIYRTTATIVIPPGKAGVPGSISSEVLADAPGAQYNMALGENGDMKVVAYKDTPKYTTVYAKLKTAITGGFLGTKKNVSPEAQNAAVLALKDSLSKKLLDAVKSKVPTDSILYPTAYNIEYEIPDPVAKDAKNAEVTVKGTLSAAIFKKNSFIKSIAAKEIDKFPAPTYRIDGMEDLKFTLINSKDFSAKKGTPLIFTLKGPITLTGTFQENALKEELKGTSLKDSNAIFAHYPAIANAYALITPFWMRSFPNSSDKISIEIKK